MGAACPQKFDHRVWQAGLSQRHGTQVRAGSPFVVAGIEKVECRSKVNKGPLESPCKASSGGAECSSTQLPITPGQHARSR